VYRLDDSLYFVPNPEIFDQVNTLEKMAAKRALVSATISVTRSSDLFVPDMEDVVANQQAAGVPQVVDAEWDDAPPPQAPPHPEPPRRTPGDIIVDLGAAKTKSARVALAREAGKMQRTQQEQANLEAAFAAWDARHAEASKAKTEPAPPPPASDVAPSDNPDEGP
jgi:hypothetical protein